VNGGVDEGSSFYENLKLAVEKGSATLVTFPVTDDYRIQPSPSAHAEAARFRIEDFRALPGRDPETLKQALMQGYGIMASFHVYENFNTYTGGIYRSGGHSGVDGQNGHFDFHGALIVGYDDIDRSFRVLNSWGPSFGDNGCFYIGYDDLNDLVRECFIIIPKGSLPDDAVPPAHVEAGKGQTRDRIIVSWERNNAPEYEVFRLGEEELYISLGRTPDNFFEDTDVMPGQHYYYFVAAHNAGLMSELSLGSEGWCHEKAEETPGIPRKFSVTRQGDRLTAAWEESANAESYLIFRFDEAAGEYVLQGKTAGTHFSMALPRTEGSTVLTFFVIAGNRYGQSLPSDPASLVIDDREKPDDEPGKETGEEEEGQTYHGDFYSFSFARFKELERRAMEYFKNQERQFRESSLNIENRMRSYFPELVQGEEIRYKRPPGDSRQTKEENKMK
jgi:hypothetical protein